jgi:RNA polymerase sigma-70 factor (ECF subfamily)
MEPQEPKAGGPRPEVTRLLRAWGEGDAAALEQLTPMVYGELRRIARRQMRRQSPGNTLQSTALVHEAYLHMVDAPNASWQDRAHFFAAASQIMRRILVDAARARASAKRGGDVRRLQLNESLDGGPARGHDLIALDDALDALAKFDPRKAKVIEMRFFGGLSVEETAAALKISPQSVLRDWKLARAWLTLEMSRPSLPEKNSAEAL